jgi:membrane protease YdiL (CAAX protease family)
VNSGPKFSASRQDAVIIGVLTLPFLLNDFANIFVSDYRVWLVVDYVLVKALPLGVILYLLRVRTISYSDLGIQRLRFGRFMIWTFTMTVLGIVLDQFGSRFFESLLPDTRLGGIPPITDPLVAQIDLYLGLALVAVVEELIFRGLYFTILSRYFPSRVVVFGISALAFGLIHWSIGLNAIIHTALIGAVFMICLWKTGSVLPTLFAHFFVNYVAFSGVLTKL